MLRSTDEVGYIEGLGAAVVGVADGVSVGAADGWADGVNVGASDGWADGVNVGALDGCSVGLSDDGEYEGTAVG